MKYTDESDSLFDSYIAEDKSDKTLRNVFKAGFDAAQHHPTMETIRLVLDTESEHFEELKMLSQEGIIGTEEYIEMIKQWIEKGGVE